MADLIAAKLEIKKVRTEEVNKILQDLKKDCDMDLNHISDGYHTFGDLYEHRIMLWITLCSVIEGFVCESGKPNPVWRSRKHSDGTQWDGWFLLGIYKEKGRQITYHLPESKWDDCRFAEELEQAPEWDGHTSADVLRRLYDL